MSETNCFQPKSLIDYVDGNLTRSQSRIATLHLAQCEACQKNWRRLKAIDAMLAVQLGDEVSNGTQVKKIKEECITDNLLYEYLEGLLGESQAAQVERHLCTCPTCLSELASLIRNSQTPITNAERMELAEIRTISPEEQVNLVLAALGDEAGKELRQPVTVRQKLTIFWERCKRLLMAETPSVRRWRFSLSLAAAAVLLLLIGWPQFRNWRSNLLVQQAISEFVAAYSYVDQDQPRSIGGFEYSLIGATRAPSSDQSLKDIRATLEKALARHPQNAAALQSLGTYCLLVENNLKDAAHYYQLAYAQDSTNALILCDLGVLAFRQQNYALALERFQTALKYQPRLIEAQFNLALTYEKLGDKPRARLEWQKYRHLDPWRSWADIAEQHIEQLNK
ncbi:MAG: zf-HC2 domain-containing protein [candidate division KSB1 bacterium]|nr:zf-HC2 domain-containing protein [candidate division KSB1 bacterium]MDZ7319570.1 zf-HC2 domain-containing protein [candidate division KSB1 bacterium]MDZ7342621.1 zf-HC2 domain-containing protein [candidate division KSB1 bacterium]